MSPPRLQRISRLHETPSRLMAVASATLLLGFAGDAQATECDSNDVDESMCDGGLANDICSLSGTGTTLSCDLAANDDDSTEGISVAAYLRSGYIEVAGSAGDSEDFCCRVAATGITRVEVLGTSIDDKIYLYCYSGSCFAPYDLTYTDVFLTGYVSGRGGADTIWGSESVHASYRDELRGDDGADTINAGAGDDLAQGGNDNDELNGEGGADEITGGTGDDEISGGNGDDTISGDADDDTLTGGEGDDTIRGGDDSDLISGGTGTDDIEGESGDDTIFGDGNWDLIHGGSGNDIVSGGDGDDIIHGDDGDDSIAGNNGSDEIYGDGNNDILCGDDENGTTDPDTLQGGPGNDTLWGPSANCAAGYYNTGSGGAGTDVVDNCSLPGYIAHEGGISSRPACPAP